MNILLGLTGSVASVLHEKLITELQKIGTVSVILTQSSKHFVSSNFKNGCRVFTDENEWEFSPKLTGHPCDPVTQVHFQWQKNDRVLHIDLRNQASALVIAPCSANTIGKIANGLCDNLLTSVVRAWDMNRPVIIVPAMNTFMWEHPVTKEHLDKLKGWGYRIIPPQSKMLACKTEGMGAMADIGIIADVVKEKLKWNFPLSSFSLNFFKTGIPQSGHPGAFLTKRKHHTHTGVDLYTYDGCPVYAVEDGTVVGIEDFTGTAQLTPWWNDTKCMLIEGASGVVCYGEITPFNHKNGTKISKGSLIGHVKRVLKEGKERPDIEGHSTSMLHMEIYKHGIYRAFEEVGEFKSDWNDLIDPTPFLVGAEGSTSRVLH